MNINAVILYWTKVSFRNQIRPTIIFRRVSPPLLSGNLLSRQLSITAIFVLALAVEDLPPYNGHLSTRLLT